MENKDSLEKQYQEVVTETMKNIIGENAKDEVRKLLKEAEEDEDSYEEEEVNDDTLDNDEDEVIDTDDVEDDDVDSIEGEDDSDDAELWNDLESCKSADGEYDCRGMDDGKLLKILKSMGPEDGIRVMSNGDGTVAVEVDGDAIDGTAEYIVDIDDFDDDDVDDDLDDDVDDDVDIDLEIDDNVDDDLDDDVDNDLDDDVDDEEDDIEVELNETDIHPSQFIKPKQNDTALTMDDDETLPTDKKKIGHTWNPQLRNATSDTRKTGDGDRQPYKKGVNEDVDECGTIFEIEKDGEEMIDEVMTSTENSAAARNVPMVHQNTNKRYGKKRFRNGRTGENGQEKGTGENSYSGDTNESVAFKKKVNKLWEENKQMKSIIPSLNKKLMESMVINASMGYVVRLLNENTTTVDEKKQITERFNKVNTLEEGKKLYETISEELRRLNKRNNVDGIINSQLAEGKQRKQNLVETTMYRSEKVNQTLDFMKRLDTIK